MSRKIFSTAQGIKIRYNKRFINRKIVHGFDTYSLNGGSPLSPHMLKMGITPLNQKEGIMDTNAKKPRVAKAPNKVEVAKVVVEGQDVVKLYKLAERGGLIASYRRAQFQQELLGREGHMVLPNDRVVVDTTNILYPTLTLLRDEAPKPKAVRKPRAPKADAGTATAPKAPRKPRTPKVE